MTNEELKKKICDIIALYVSAYGDDERIADALIAAGLTFDKTTAILAERTNGKTLIHKAQYYDEMKHRAEVAERALLNLCVDIQPYSLFDQTPLVTEASVKMQEYLQQAEKELAEERKDD